MTTDDTETDEKSMSRRSVLSGAGVVAGGWLVNKLTGGAVSVAKAQSNQEYRIEFAPDDITTWAIDDEVQGDGTTDLIIKHVPSDTTVRWDRSEGSFDFSEIQSFIVDSLTANEVTTETATIDGDPAGGFGGTESMSPGFDSWTTASADRPVFLMLDVKAETDGSSNGVIVVEVDETGGTSSDYSMVVGWADASLGTGYISRESTAIYVPAGGTYRISNNSNPTGGNDIFDVRQLTL